MPSGSTVVRTRAISLSLSACILAIAASAPAFAEDATSPAAVPADAAAESGEGLNTITVTATKRETDLQKTPIAISVVDPTMIKDRHVQSLLDLADGSVPSLRVATFEARKSALTVGIRGMVPFDQNQTARDTPVGVYVDGVYLGRSQGLNAALFDVARIEVLKGPQGTLFGRNTEGGALNIVTKEPTGEFGGRISGGFGNYGSHDAQVHLDFPAFANLAIKADGVIQHQDATVKNPLAGQYGWNYDNAVGGRITAKWTPVSGFTALLSYDKSKDENTPNYSQLISYNPNNYPVGSYDAAGSLVCPTGSTFCVRPLSPIVHVSGDKRQDTAEIGVPQQLSTDKTEGFASTLKYEVTPDLELRSISAWRTVTTDQWDNSGGAHRTVFTPNTAFSRYSLSHFNQRQFSQEFQAVGSMAHLDYVFGAYYFNEKAHELAATPSSNKWNADGTGYTINSENAIGPITSGNQGWDPASWFVQRNSVAHAKSYALFGQATYSPIDIVHLTVGARWTHDKRNGLLFTVQGKPTAFPFTYDKKRVDPLVVLAVDAAPGVNLYAKYSTGYRAGGANDRSQTFTAFLPESVKAYEVGAKTTFWDNRARFNIAGYIMDRKGTQTDFDNVDTNPSSPTFNAHTEETRNAPGTTKVRGIEADLTIKPVEALTLGASYAYTYFKVPATPNPFLNNQPFQVNIVYTPRNAASGFIDYEMPVSRNGTTLRAHIDANYASSQYSFQAENTKTDASFVVNGSVALADIPMGRSGTKTTISFWVRNLFDTTYIYRRSSANSIPAPVFANGVQQLNADGTPKLSYSGVLGDYGNLNPPRTFGVQAQIQF
ncbi:TonB-dependent receptor [Novosphingobium sp.]|uniref:TonB-dependent receptor n=1 Tax=Novosphingobium sp. TaxID=1874826 RepID=UPI003FA57994